VSLGVGPLDESNPAGYLEREGFARLVEERVLERARQWIEKRGP
jgi:hypothetical protein